MSESRTTQPAAASTSPKEQSRLAERLRRSWPLVVIASLLVLSLAFELLRYQHTIGGQLPAFVTALLLAVALLPVMLSAAISRPSRAVISLALSVGLLFAVVQLRLVDPLVGDWNVTFGAPATVAISKTQEGYVLTAKSPTRVHTSETCELAPGTVIATFDGAAPTYQGRLGLWNVATCQFGQWSPTTFTLGDRTIDAVLADRELFILTREG